jgi:hypothetical protein
MDSPKTLSLEAPEWSALAILAVNTVGGVMAQIAQSPGSRLSDDHAGGLTMALQRAMQLVEAWRRTSQMAPRVESPAEGQRVNGPAKVRKGWPKGKRRKPPQPAEQTTN